jgi:HEAT repeat protein
MRFLLILGAGIFLFLGTSSLPAQKIKKEQDKGPATDTQIQEIGGKTLEEWIKEISSKDRSRGENAIRTVIGFGPDRAYAAVPALLAELKTRSVEVDVSIRVNAVIMLGNILALGAAEKPDPEVINEAVKVLTFFLYPPNESQSIVRYRAAEALGRIGPRSKPAIPRLLTMLHDKMTWETRRAAAIALGYIALDRDGKKGPPADVVKGLYTALTDKSFQVRLAAIQSMTFIGTPASTTEKDRDTFVKHLEKATGEKEDPTVRIWAHMAVMSITHKMSPEQVKAICDMLKHREVAVRLEAAGALFICGSSAFNDDSQVKERNVLRNAISPLMRGLYDKEPVVALKCMVALASMKNEAKKAIPNLQAISQDMKRPEGLRRAATEAIEMINHVPVQVAPKVPAKVKGKNQAN